MLLSPSRHRDLLIGDITLFKGQLATCWGERKMVKTEVNDLERNVEPNGGSLFMSVVTAGNELEMLRLNQMVKIICHLTILKLHGVLNIFIFFMTVLTKLIIHFLSSPTSFFSQSLTLHFI